MGSLQFLFNWCLGSMASFLYLTPICPCFLLLHSFVLTQCRISRDRDLPLRSSVSPWQINIAPAVVITSPFCCTEQQIISTREKKGPSYSYIFWPHCNEMSRRNVWLLTTLQVLCRRVDAVVSLSVATAVVPQQGYVANFLTPSVTQVLLPL